MSETNPEVSSNINNYSCLEVDDVKYEYDDQRKVYLHHTRLNFADIFVLLNETENWRPHIRKDYAIKEYFFEDGTAKHPKANKLAIFIAKNVDLELFDQRILYIHF